MGLKKKKRLGEFLIIKQLYKNSNYVEGKFYKIKFVLNDKGYDRFAFSLKKRCNAVKRNYEKRILKEFIRGITKYYKTFFDFLILIKNTDGEFINKKIEFNKLYDKIHNHDYK